MFIFAILRQAGSAAVLLLLAVAGLLVRSHLRDGRAVGAMSPEARGELLHNGLRAQATITEVHTSGGGRVYVTSASGVDPVSGGLTTYVQRGARSIGRRGEPVTVLVDAARPHVYLIVA
jgi:hypothetical protein